MPLQLLSLGHGPLHVLPQVKLGHATSSTTLQVPFKPVYRHSKTQRYSAELITRAAYEEEAVASEETPDVVVAKNPFLELGIDKKLLVRIHNNIVITSSIPQVECNVNN